MTNMNRKMWIVIAAVVALNAIALYVVYIQNSAVPESTVSNIEPGKKNIDQAIDMTRMALATLLQVDPKTIQTKKRAAVLNSRGSEGPLELNHFCMTSDLQPFDIDLNLPSFQSPSGSFMVKNDKTFVLEAEKDKPVWVVYPVQISRGQDASITVGQNLIIQFDYRFGGSGGLLSVFWDNQLVYKADQRVHGNSNEWTEGIPVGPDTSEGLHQLSFRLDTFSEQASSVGVTRLVWEKRSFLKIPCLDPETEIVDVTFTQGDSDFRYYVNEDGGFVRTQAIHP